MDLSQHDSTEDADVSFVPTVKICSLLIYRNSKSVVFHPEASFQENRLIQDYHNELIMEVMKVLEYLQTRLTGEGVHFNLFVKR